MALGKALRSINGILTQAYETLSSKKREISYAQTKI